MNNICTECVGSMNEEDDKITDYSVNRLYAEFMRTPEHRNAILIFKEKSRGCCFTAKTDLSSAYRLPTGFTNI